ncbi:MAG TPA: hypothetical protein VF173_34935 [Thermoanaerobaculia bacterium]|nr:hypothetical protein [Thermoanaerobaculia bacterium]
MRRVIFGVGLVMLLLPFAVWAENAPAAAPAGDPTAACVQTPSLDLILGQGNLTTAATPFMPLCNCTTERAACASDCQSQDCRGSHFVCNTADPCDSTCTCNRCLP